MSTVTTPSESLTTVEYPEDDGLPMSDNDLQYEWIVTIKGGLDAVFRDDPNVYVAGNLLWYPVEGDNKTRMAPDVLVAFGRPKATRRGSYLQWLEANVPPQVVFEVLSPGNKVAEMVRKHQFYQRFGVEEYYLIDPRTAEVSGWCRDAGGDELREIADLAAWRSPRLGIRFEVKDEVLTIHGPDDRRFATYLEISRQRDEAEHRAERLAARLRELGIDPDA